MNRIFSILVCLGVALNLGAAPLRFNFRSADITPLEEDHTMLAGFAARNDLHDGVHTPLKAGCFVFLDKGTGRKVCVVSLDMMELAPVLADELRDSIQARTGIGKDNILLHCIHTHSAPRVGGRWIDEGAANRPFYLRFKESVLNLAVSTINDEGGFRKFKVEIGKCSTSISGNRCEKEGPVDRDVYAVRFLDRKGKPICAFINLACHPVCMGPRSYLAGADYSGVARGIISKKWGCEVFQFSGAQGNLDPAEGPKTFEYAEQCGRSLSDSLSTIVFTPFEMDGTLALSTNVTRLPFRIPEVTAAEIHKLAQSLKKEYATSFPRFADDVDGWEKQMVNELGPDAVIRSLDVNMTGLNIGGLVFVFSQGEAFCEYQTGLRTAFPDKTVIFAGYTNGQSAYIPSERAFEVRKGYEYELEQDFVYVKRPYPLSEQMPQAFQEGLVKTAAMVAGAPRYDIIPAPLKLTASSGEFSLGKRMRVAASPQFVEIADDFRARMGEVGGLRLRSSRRIFRRGVELVKVDGLAPEAYRLKVTKRKVTVEASDYAGAFYALQTFCQMLPAEVYSASRVSGVAWTAPCCEIEDSPRFAYRGMLLDCGRYFYPKEEVKKFIDLMAMHKMNYLQWHLTEDQGWRIEIKKFPRLTEVGAYRKETSGYDNVGDGKPHGGFYTQDDVREIVEYARRRAVTIIPEIELPGHSSAAIAAYPELSCTPDEPKEVVTSWGVKEDVYCPRPETFAFLEDVFSELFDLFPSPYYHFGGDECPKTAWRNSEYCKNFAREKGLDSVDDIQDYFVAHFDNFLRRHGKTVIGWDEILDGKATESTVVMSYRGHKPASRAMEKGMKTILCPNRWCYFDYQQQEIEDKPSNQHLFITLRKAYNWSLESMIEPETLAKGGDGLLGLQACVWGEHIPDVAKLQLQTYPREAAIAETSWSATDNRDWNNFKTRMPKELKRMGFAGVVFSDAFNNVIVNMDLESDYPRSVELEIDNLCAVIRYTTDGSEPGAGSEVVPSSIRVQKGDTIKARGFLCDGTPVGETMTRTF